MRFFLSLLLAGVMTATAAAQPFYARGTFGNPALDYNGGDPLSPFDDLTYEMTNVSGNHWTVNVGGQFDNLPFDYKLANQDYSIAGPGSNGRVTTNAAGEINFHLYNQTSWTDGYYPRDTIRVGYDDHQQFDWEVVGSFNEWPGDGDPNFYLTDQGDGLHMGQFAFDAGIYNFKFRQQDSWDTSIGGDFGNSAGNNEFRVWENGDLWNFELDLPKGRWRAYSTAPNPDVNEDKYVDAADYVSWRKNAGTETTYNSFVKHFGSGPPPPAPAVFYARGSFGNPDLDYNGGTPSAYDDLSYQMVDQGGGLYVGTVTGQTPGAIHTFKIANEDYSLNAPDGGFNDGKVAVDADGEIKFYFWDTTSWDDGWFPNNQRRVGYDDHQQFEWELMGSWTSFGSPTDLVDLGNGLHRAEIALAGSGTGYDAMNGYSFKFRKDDDWNVSIGSNFGNSASNAITGLIGAGTYWFELDLRNGRWRVVPAALGGGGAVPEPSSLALALILGLATCASARRR